ncbi:unnamed protein product, partial [Allacma fusca]
VFMTAINGQVSGLLSKYLAGANSNQTGSLNGGSHGGELNRRKTEPIIGGRTRLTSSSSNNNDNGGSSNHASTSRGNLLASVAFSKETDSSSLKEAKVNGNSGIRDSRAGSSETSSCQDEDKIDLNENQNGCRVM